jgi:predicted RNA-binding Zn ribbon-like protein
MRLTAKRTLTGKNHSRDNFTCQENIGGKIHGMSEKRPIDAIQRLGGRLCLDFINTVHRRPAGPGDEYLHALEDFLAWTVPAGLLPAATAEDLARLAGGRARDVLRELLELRELLHRLFRPLAESHDPAPADLAAFETHACAARARQRLRFADGRAAWYSPPPAKPGIALADPILADAEDLLTGGRLDRLKQCEPEEGCGWLFLDISRNRSRRWCSMETCGSAAKARAWYRRHRQPRG